jgi:DNA-binding beta-propeller fold protein YncE
MVRIPNQIHIQGEISIMDMTQNSLDMADLQSAGSLFSSSQNMYGAEPIAGLGDVLTGSPSSTATIGEAITGGVKNNEFQGSDLYNQPGDLFTEANSRRQPSITAKLKNDTVIDGGTRRDRITSDPTITGRVRGDLQGMKLFASLKEAPLSEFTQVPDSLINPQGKFTLDMPFLEQVNSGILGEGQQTVHMMAMDKNGKVSQDFDVNFELNRVVMGFVNMMDRKLGLVNTETNALVWVPLDNLKGFPEGRPQHVSISPDESKIFIGTDSSLLNPSDKANWVTIDVKSIDWSGGTANLKVTNIEVIEPAGTKSDFPNAQQIDPSQPIATWTQPEFAQIHGPTFLPGTNYGYINEWTGNKVQWFDRTSGKLVAPPTDFGKNSAQLHGINFNNSGDKGLGVGYYYDQNDVEVFSVDKSTGKPELKSTITLTSDKGDGAFQHYAYWVNDNQALVGAMQLGPTSLTPEGTKILGPSIWLLDVKENKAEPIILPTDNVDGNGMFRSPSDIGVVGNKLFVAEEDSLDGTFGNDGYISIFDITSIKNPQLITRLKPGVELPKDFSNGHVVSVTPDKKHIYVSSFASNHIAKINAETNKVEKIYDSKDGLDMPHGEALAGVYR